MIKNLIYPLLSASLFLFGSSGCSNFLNVDKLGKNDVPKTFSDMDGLRTSLTGMYRLLYNYYDGDYLKYSEVAADMIDLRPTASDMIVQYNYLSQQEDVTTSVEYIWRDGYHLMANANNILYYAPDLKATFPHHAKEIDLICAQALFVRALTHFMICNTYAQPYNYTSDASHIGIPALTRLPGANDLVKRNSVAEVYQRITEDLRDAYNLFGSLTIESPYFISGMACRALQARIYLYMGDMQAALECASDVIAAMTLTPRSDYARMMQAEVAGSEAIFRINGIRINSHTLRKFYGSDGSAFASSKFSGTFYDNNDVRWQMLSGNILRKYWNPSEDLIPKPNEFEIPFAPFILRLTEIYLIRAEAYCEMNQPAQAAADLKAIIARAIGKPVEEVVLNYSGAADLMNIVERERILELTGEGHRLFDITRWKQNMVRNSDTNSSVRTVTYPNNRFILPIPRTEMDGNKGMVQNPM